jgi:hypothetical protein
MPQETKRKVQITVRAQLLESEAAAERPKAAAYLFSRGGRLLAHASLDAQGSAVLEVPAGEAPTPAMLAVGPEMDVKELQVGALTRRGADVRRIRIDPKIKETLVEMPVIPGKWRCWLLGRCYVRGSVLKRVTLAGSPLDLPVCHATVEIYEVDPWPLILARTPDRAIEQIREAVVRPRIPKPPGPIPPVETAVESLIPGPIPPPPVFAFGAARTAETASSGTALRMTEMVSVATAPAELQVLAETASTQEFRLALPKYIATILPRICWIWPLVTKHLVATATTDECGRFQTFFFRGCFNPDTPDLYFIVRQRVFPFPFPPITIYAPTPVACYTHWNYACGTEVTLYTTHPLARTCSPCLPVNAPNNWVLVMAVGNLPLSRIYGASVPLQATTTADNQGLRDDEAPFGGLLRLRLEFDNSLREDLNVKYYRASYRKAGATGEFTPMTGTVVRHYAVEVGDDVVLKNFDVGPKVINNVPNLFEIPPALPPEGQWSIPDAVEDTTSAKFQTLDLGPLAAPGVGWPEHGKYEIKVDLFDVNGNLVDIDAAATPIHYVVPSVTDLSGDIDTDDAGTLGLVVDDNLDGKRSFIMKLHVDNSRCLAAISAPTLDGTAAGINCGVLQYNPATPGSVVMGYTPAHPHGIGSRGFATYSFYVYRGGNQLVFPPPPTAPALPVSGRSPNPVSALTVTEAVTDLLGGCTVAGFAEDLHVWAMATDGWRRLWEYDSYTAFGFVLSPKTP